MKISVNKKQLYLIAAMILLATLLILSSMENTDSDRNNTDGYTHSPSPSPILTPAPSAEASARPESTMNTVVYYQDDYGYLVPVMRTIKAQEGVAKATLNLMVKSVYNDMEAARLGLRTVIPENTSIDLDISSGVAHVDLGKEALSCPDAAAESVMVNAIVHALTGFDTVDSVMFTINGHKTETLTNGTPISGEFHEGALNLESSAYTSGSEMVTLYFTGESPSMIVPVTRVVYGSGDLQTAVVELVKGPGVSSPLNGVIPAGCGLISAEVKNRIAQINFTEDFIRIAEETDGGRLALRALVLTCLEFDGVDSVEILVEGKPYDTGEGTLAAPTFVNSAGSIEDAFILKQSEELFEFE